MSPKNKIIRVRGGFLFIFTYKAVNLAGLFQVNNEVDLLNARFAKFQGNNQLRILKNFSCKTIKSENFITTCSEEKNIVVFTCETILKYLCSVDKVYLDGTFNYCLNYFTQLFSLHLVINGHYIPLVFCILPSKKSETYQDTLQLPRVKCYDLGLIFSPKYVVVDFEKSIHNDLMFIWPHINIIGCRFHLAQSWFRKIQELGLVTEYRNVASDVGKWLNYTFGLPFLNPEEVSDYIVMDLFSIQPDDIRLTKYSDYLIDTYINEDATLPPHTWASFTASMDRTTNCCESFHAKFNGNFYKTHPSLYVFVNVVNEIQTETYIKLQSIYETCRIKDPATRRRHQFLVD